MKLLPFVLLILPLLARADEREECRLALIEETEGNAVVLSADGKGGPIEGFESITPGDQIKTGKNAWVDLRLCDGSGLRVGEEARFLYDGVSQERESFLSWAFQLVRGPLMANVTGDGGGERVKMKIKTPNAAMGIRGTEFVIDVGQGAQDETTLHTLEGEVLMGHADDFEKLESLRGPELVKHFEPVGKEKMSAIRRGQARPLRAAAFKAWEFRAGGRKALFGRKLEKKGWTEIRQNFKDRFERFKVKREGRGVFERPREKILKHMGGSGPAQNLRAQQPPVRQQRREERKEARQQRKEDRSSPAAPGAGQRRRR